MNIVYLEINPEHFVVNNEGNWVNFNSKKVTVVEPCTDGSGESVEKEVYKVYQKWSRFTPTLRERKQAILEGIAMYDKSDAVNTFKYNGNNYWLDRETRVSVMNTTNILKAKGMEMATLWIGNLELTLPCDTIIGILSDLEMYALQCYNVTQRHINNVNSMTLENAYNYDFEVDYPNPIEFNIQ